MRQPEVRPGLWSTTGGAVIAEAADYEKDHLQLLLGHGLNSWPRPPRGKVVASASRAASFSDDDLAARIRRGRRGPRPRQYPIMQVARSATKSLCRIAEVAIPWTTRSLKAVAADYWRFSAAEEPGATIPALLIDPSREKEIVKRTAAFVLRYGPLVRDFALWCSEVQSRVLVERHGPSFLGGETALAHRTGREHRLWSVPWLRWARAIQQAGCECPGQYEPAPAPLEFYVWAALMVTALRLHPELPGCQLFLLNRLSSMRLVSVWANRVHPVRRLAALARERGESFGDELRRAPVQVDGSLLDYLAAAAASPEWRGNLVPCANCRHPFETNDGRRRYCKTCSNKRTRDRLAARRYRAKDCHVA